jgi:hypothetical protein
LAGEGRRQQGPARHMAHHANSLGTDRWFQFPIRLKRASTHDRQMHSTLINLLQKCVSIAAVRMGTLPAPTNQPTPLHLSALSCRTAGYRA